VVNRIILTAGALNLVIAFLAAPKYQQTGMAVSVLVSEIYVCICMVLAVLARSPFWQEKTFRATELAGRPEGDL
jgi:O-antigen/teichoic acid export membrane protein